MPSLKPGKMFRNLYSTGRLLLHSSKRMNARVAHEKHAGAFQLATGATRTSCSAVLTAAARCVSMSAVLSHAPIAINASIDIVMGEIDR